MENILKLTLLASSVAFASYANAAVEVTLGSSANTAGSTFTYSGLTSGGGAVTFDDAIPGGATVGTNSIAGATGSFTVTWTATQASASHDPSTWTFGAADAGFKRQSSGWGVASTGDAGGETQMDEEEAFLLTFDLSGLTLDAGKSLVFSALTSTGATADTFQIYERTGTSAGVVASSSNLLNAGNYATPNVTVDGLLQFAITDAGYDSGALLRIDGFSVDVVAVPEPSTYALLSGLLALGFVMVRRRK